MKKKVNYWTRLLRTVRQEWSRNNPQRKECLKNALIKIEGLDKYKCKNCGEFFAKSEVNVDHIDPVGNTIPISIGEFYKSFDKMHVSVEDLQILCVKRCHKMKTKQDNFNVKYKHAVGSVCLYLGISDVSVSDMPWQIIRKLDLIINKIRESTDPKEIAKYEKNIDDLKKKYL